MDANMAPCSPTTFHRAILSEHDIVSSRCPYKEPRPVINITNSHVYKRKGQRYLYNAIPCLNAIATFHRNGSFAGFNLCP